LDQNGWGSNNIFKKVRGEYPTAFLHDSKEGFMKAIKGFGVYFKEENESLGISSIFMDSTL
jgi:hypothetical protein